MSRIPDDKYIRELEEAVDRLTEITRAQAAHIKVLLEDKARLDWLEDNYCYPYRDEVYADGEMHGRSPFGGWRQALDRGMKEAHNG